MKTITVDRIGSLAVKDGGDEDRVPPAPNRLRVRVKYAGVGFTDVMAVRRGYFLAPKRPFSPGYEFFGRVEEVSGSTALSPKDAPAPRLVPGTRVVGMLPKMGAYREWIDVDPGLLVPVPSEVTDEKAALLPLNYLTAYAMMTRCTRLEKGQSFLIHGAAGGVGTAALELARVSGLKAYGTASPVKHDLVRSLGGIPINRRGDAWMDELLQLEPLGVDAAFDAYGVESFRKSWRVLASKGTLVCYGMSPTIDGGTGEFIKGALYIIGKKVFSRGKRAEVCGLPAIIGSDHEWYRAAMTKILEWTRTGAFQPVLAGVAPWNEVEEIHGRLAEGSVKGKFLLDFSR